MSPRISPRRVAGVPLLAVATAASLWLGAASAALAHAELVTSDPADKAILDAPPTAVTLTFSEGLDAAKSSFKLSGPGGAIGTGKAARDGDTTMTLGGLELAAGDYTVKWTSAALDGHIDRGQVTFSVAEVTSVPAASAPAASAPAAGSTNAAPSVAQPSSAAMPSSAAASDGSNAAPAGLSPAPSDAGSPAGAAGSDVLLPIVVGLLIVGVIGVLVLRRSRLV